MDCKVVCLGTMFSSYFIFCFFRLSMEEKNNIGGYPLFLCKPLDNPYH
jgi:hypothetical protein